MATHVSKITGIFLLLLFILNASCTKNKQVYYTPNKSGKQAIVPTQLNQVDVADFVLADTFKQIDSPIINNTERNKAILKKYSFDDETVGDKQQDKKRQGAVAKKPKLQKSTGSITGIVLVGIGLLWMILASSDGGLSATGSALSGCAGVFFSLILTLIGGLTIAISFFITSY